MINSNIDDVEAFIVSCAVNQKKTPLLLKCNGRTLTTVDKTNFGLWDKFLFALRHVGIGPYNLKKITQFLSKSSESSSNSSLALDILQQKRNRLTTQEMQHKIVDASISILKKYSEQFDNLNALKNLEQDLAQLIKNRQFSKSQSQSVGEIGQKITQKINIEVSNILVQNCVDGSTTHLLDRICKADITTLKELLGKVKKEYPLTSRLRFIEEMHIKLQQEVDKSSKDYVKVSFEIANYYNSIGNLEEAAKIYREIIKIPIVYSKSGFETWRRIESAENLFAAMTILKDYDGQREVIELVNQMKNHLINNKNAIGEEGYTESVQEFVDLEKKLSDQFTVLQQFNTATKADSSRFNFTEKEWEALQLCVTLAEKDYEGTDEQLNFITNFFTHVVNNPEFNKKTRDYEKKCSEGTKVLNDIIDDFSSISFKMNPQFISDNIQITERFSNVYKKQEKQAELRKINEEEIRLRTLVFNFDKNSSITIDKENYENAKGRLKEINGIKKELNNEISKVERLLSLQENTIANYKKNEVSRPNLAKMSLEEIRKANSASNLYNILEFYKPRLPGIKANMMLRAALSSGKQLKNTLTEIQKAVEIESIYESGDLSLKNIYKFSELTKKNQREMELYPLINVPFAHAAIIDNSENKLKFSEINSGYNNNKVELEEMITHDKFRLMLDKALSPTGKKIIVELLEKKGIEPSDEKIATLLREEFQDAIEETICPLGNAILTDELSEELRALKIPLDAWKSETTLSDWLKNYNESRSQEHKKSITMDQLLTPDLDFYIEPLVKPDDNADKSVIKEYNKQLKGYQKKLGKWNKLESKKRHMRNKMQRKQFETIENSLELRKSAFKRSFLDSFVLGKKVDPGSIAMEGGMICSQFVMSVTLIAVAKVEEKLKEDYKKTVAQCFEFNPLNKIKIKSLEKNSLFTIPTITSFSLKAMTPDMLMKKLASFLKPLPSPSIYKDLIDVPKNFFEPHPILSSINQMASVLSDANKRGRIWKALRGKN